ncbi:MAG: MarR family transcriptional regulator [Armatimonadetes bacterium]|nr:MarR family transcriptional regulator [Armatimonadota bacterium]
MSNDVVREQAVAVNALFSKLARRLNKLETGDPVTELPVAQMRVCFALLEKPRTMGCLSKELGISLSAVTQLADRLEKAELVERYVESDDLRMKRMRLSSHGEEIMTTRRERRIERLVKILECMPAQDRELITPAFQRLYDASLKIDLGSEADMLPIVEQILD